jgi:lipopolysaccharide/colanic/teichoic acid biosynthesis glycosyltransferase
MDEVTELRERLKILYIGGNKKVTKEYQDASSLFDIIESENGLEAINQLKKIDKLDAIICEAHLPGINGMEIFRMLKAKAIHQHTPFILITHETEEKLKNLAIKERVDDFYLIPLDIEEIYTRIVFLNKYKKEIEKNKPDNKINKIKDYKIPIIKRTFDIVVSGFALIFLTPVFLFVAIVIRIESKGKVYYKSKRVGTGYKIFDFYKFRSMYTGADAKLKELNHLNQYAQPKIDEGTGVDEFQQCPKCAELPENEHCSPTLFTGGKKVCEYWFSQLKMSETKATFVKIKNDPRVTKIGKFIRNTSIDELPQLINVLKGDMSIVGNRPLPLYEAELLTSDDWSERFLGPAGITGLWQVELRGMKGDMSEEERKSLDNQYAGNYSFFGDIRLILRTIPALFQKENV